jgi:hypothetical protein
MALAGQTGWAATWHEKGAERPRAESWLGSLPESPRFSVTAKEFRSNSFGSLYQLEGLCRRAGLALGDTVRLRGVDYVGSYY